MRKRSAASLENSLRLIDLFRRLFEFWEIILNEGPLSFEVWYCVVSTEHLSWDNCTIGGSAGTGRDGNLQKPRIRSEVRNSTYSYLSLETSRGKSDWGSSIVAASTWRLFKHVSVSSVLIRSRFKTDLPGLWLYLSCNRTVLYNNIKKFILMKIFQETKSKSEALHLAIKMIF